MAKFVLNEQTLIDNNIFKYEKRLNTPLNRFIDKTPIFVTYWHVNNAETTADEGFQDTEEIIGRGSSIRYQKVTNFPIYGLEALTAQLSDSDFGLDSTIESEAVILPGTLKPFPNDLFVIDSLRTNMIFRVINIEYDNIRPDGFYKISFRLEWTDDEKLREVEHQVVDKFRCLYDNIGSENKAIMKTDEYDHYIGVCKMYDDMASMYIAAYYNERYNCFLGDFRNDGKILYDPLMSVFIDKHGIFNNKNSYSAIVLSEQFTDVKRLFKYEKSMYRFFEKRDIRALDRFFYQLLPGENYHESSFHRWRDANIMVVDTTEPLCPNDPENFLFSNEFIDGVRLNLKAENEYTQFLVDYLWGKIETVMDVPLNLKDVLLSLNLSKESFFFTPIVLYIIREAVKGYNGDKEVTLE